MSEALKQAASLKESKQRNEKKLQQTKKEGSKESSSQDGVSEIYSRKETVSNKTQTDSQNTDTDVKSSVKTKAAPKKSETKEKGFGGFSKGFLSGLNTKSEPVTRSSSSSSKKKTDTKEEIPFIEKKDDNESLRLSEVQETMNKTSENLMKNQEWVTDDLLGKVGESQSVMEGFKNPEYVKIIAEFQANPQEAMEKYKDHTKFQEFFREFCKLMGDHFGALGSKESGEQVSNGVVTDPQIKAVPESEGAQMSVRSSTNPKQPTAEDERKMQEILSDPEIKLILQDPKIAQLLEKARSNPEAAQSLVHNGDADFKKKVHKLVSVGLLQFQV